MATADFLPKNCWSCSVVDQLLADSADRRNVYALAIQPQLT